MKRTVQKLTNKDFQWTQWGMQDMKIHAATSMDNLKKTYTNIKNIPAHDRTFQNVVFEMESASAVAEDVLQKIFFLHDNHPLKKIRDTGVTLVKEMEKQLVDIEFDPELFQAVKDVKKNEYKSLNTIDKRLLNEYIRGYKQMGFDLPEAKQKELKRVIKQINALASDFSININNYEDYILVSRNELDGLPQSYISRLKEDSKTHKYKVSLDYPEYFPFMKLAHSEKKRDELFFKSARKGGKKNITILQKVLQLRSEQAKLLGYKNYAEYKTENKMVKNGKTVERFQEGLVKKVAQGSREELQELKKYKKKISNKPFISADIAYLSNLLQKERFDVDSEFIKQHFPLEHVKQAMIDLYSNLFDIEFIKLKHNLWHKDAEMYAIKSDGQINGYIGMDLHPRKGKYGHAAVFGITSSRKKIYKKSDQAYIPATCVLVTNFSRSTKSEPSLLSLGDVEALFHECGHALHHALTKAQYPSHSGTSVARDFVEAPSQILENWVTDPQVLQKISSHYKTGEPLSLEYIEKMKDSEMFMKKNFTARQLVLGIFDYTLHIKSVKDTQKLFRSLIKKNTGGDTYPNAYFAAGFDHLMGYEVNYYGYLWSKVYADDMYTEFEKNGPLNKRIGKKFKREILEVGSSRDEMDSVKAFLGRRPNNKAFLRKLGVK